ncbi:hypothetical protein [Staphylococcus epidermidis]|uniref:hypothetical protein n=1 Tax=Staphylococcus epidermidis TaxID=1282 RepID=UPI0019CF8B25|nr:hypothetical protein [Staphylococcus epidermidis]MBN6837000.1 hypothetical protein [Staphylococcus epidermidis]MCG1194442.1 hypothetical protein [Staphylococcus epidermidis]MCG1702970.1 hypothetical protein [Staphylococcus epidermidis]MCG2046985.1 hypothetical protein [Staphylococcus epidermidis]MCG2193633.1 hypothetical protein [Staphylococcus epidermidis]
MVYDISERLKKYAESHDQKENLFHFGMYVALTSLAGTIIYMFSSTAIWITPLNMSVASFLILLMGMYKRKDKRAFLLFYMYGTQKKEISKSLIFGIIFLLVGFAIFKLLKWFNFSHKVNYSILALFKSSFHFLLEFLFTMSTMFFLTIAISLILKPIALLIVKRVMDVRKDV